MTPHGVWLDVDGVVFCFTVDGKLIKPLDVELKTIRKAQDEFAALRRESQARLAKLKGGAK